MLVMVAATLFPTSIAVTLRSRPDTISRVSRLDAPSTSPSVSVSVVGIVIVDCGSDSSGGGDRGGDNSGGGGGVAGDNVKSIGHRGVDNCCGVKSSSYSAAFSAGRGSDQSSGEPRFTANLANCVSASFAAGWIHEVTLSSVFGGD